MALGDSIDMIQNVPEGLKCFRAMGFTVNASLAPE